MSKNKKAKTTVNVDAVRKEAKKLAKQVANAEAPNRTHAELAPGSVNRQSPLEQEMGSKKYKEMIHNRSTHKNASPKRSLKKRIKSKRKRKTFACKTRLRR